ncbi:MAG: DUF1573 domain-containing protein [Planctomycetaceae bacterium]|jgi:hypothetical protein|nr:DUF1573 domain-containing protein [Planctomycetaceae bacterium]
MRNNRFFLLVFALIAGLSSFAMTFYAARENHKSPTPQPPDGLVALNAPLDLGDIPQDILDGTFELINKSKKPVRMVQIVQSCRCTQIEAPNKEIEPNETVKIAFKWDSSGVRGVKGSRFTVFYSEEGRVGLRSLTLFVKGNIIPLFDLVPTKLEFTVGKAETKNIKLVPYQTSSDITIEEVSNVLPAFHAEKISDREISVTFLPEEWVDDSEKVPYIVLKTNSKKERHCDVFINVSK